MLVSYTSGLSRFCETLKGGSVYRDFNNLPPVDLARSFKLFRVNTSKI